MAKNKEIIFESALPELGDDFWLEQGKNLFENTVNSLNEAAKLFITGIGLMKGIYLGILGFSDVVANAVTQQNKFILIVPFLCWILSLFYALRVIVLQREKMFIFSPEDIREKYFVLVKSKRFNLKLSFYTFVVGLFSAFIFLIVHIKNVN